MSVVARSGVEANIGLAEDVLDDRGRVHRVALLDIDVADGLQPIPSVDALGTEWTAAVVLVRVFTEPIGVLNLSLFANGVSVQELARRILEGLGPQVRERVSAAGLELDWSWPVDGLHPERTPPYLKARESVLRDGPSITVAICTRGRPEGLSRTLTSLAGQEYPAMRVLVVDNAPPDDRTRLVAAEHASRLDLSYVVEPRPGLSRARNRAIEASDSEVVAWIDDDEEVCDRWWAAEVARGFVEHSGAGAVTGMILPAELETNAQVWFEQYGGHSKGRGFAREVFSVTGGLRQSPLYPLPPFGTGGNMAFTREALESIGGFDCALGAGTPTLAGEDTAAFSTLLYKGGTVVWQPTAIMRHSHRRDAASLSKLFHGYGCGLSAFYTSMVVHHPGSLPELLRLAPRGVMDFFSSDGLRLGNLPSDFPKDLLKTHRRGLLQGPAMYARALIGTRGEAGKTRAGTRVR